MSVKQMLSGLPAGGQKIKAAVLTTSRPPASEFMKYILCTDWLKWCGDLKIGVMCSVLLSAELWMNCSTLKCF